MTLLHLHLLTPPNTPAFIIYLFIFLKWSGGGAEGAICERKMIKERGQRGRGEAR